MLQDLKVALFLASREIKRGNKGTVFVTIFIMALAVLNMLFMPSLMEGIDHKSKLQIVETQLGHVVVEPKDGERLLSDAHLLQKRINAFPEVEGIALHYSVGVTLYFEDKVMGRSVCFIDPEDEKTVTNVHKKIVEGDYLTKLDTDEVILGSETAGTYDPIDEANSLGGVKAGDWIDIKFGNGIRKTYRVKGVFKTRLINADYGVFLNNKERENVIPEAKDRTDSIIIKLREEDKEYEFIKKLTELGIGEDVFNSRDRAGLDISQTFNIINAILSGIALLVSATTLFIVIYINAINKRRIIAVMKAVGINKEIIISSFIFQSLFYAICGVVLGLTVLYFILVPYFIANPLILPFGQVTLLIKTDIVYSRSIALGVTAIVAGFVPAYQVTKQNIIDAMRS